MGFHDRDDKATQEEEAAETADIYHDLTTAGLHGLAPESVCSGVDGPHEATCSHCYTALNRYTG